ncbi:MAG: type II toxin-antitoxin system RelE/ParE family toxin [Pseudomonadota bacterium]
MTPPKYAIRLLRAAEEDLRGIMTYVALDNPSAAAALADKIENRLSGLSSHPLLGKIPDEAELAHMGYRFLVVQNYLIFYTIEERVIWVHRIIHGARNYVSLL